MAVAVQRNPSPMAVSVLTGKITGYWWIFGPFDARGCEESPVPQRFLDQFPTKDIGEFQKPKQESPRCGVGYSEENAGFSDQAGQDGASAR